MAVAVPVEVARNGNLVVLHCVVHGEQFLVLRDETENRSVVLGDSPEEVRRIGEMIARAADLWSEGDR